jgi:hypothetical protein
MAKRKKEYSFPTVSACPRCRGTQTRATSTQGKIQYRKCLAPVCQKTYTVIGQKVKIRTQMTQIKKDNTDAILSQMWKSHEFVLRS